MFGVVSAGFAVALATAPAQAVPNLQFYVEGATYCTTICPNSTLNPGGAGAFKDSWAISGTTGLRLWVVGDADIFDVHFIASYNHDVGAGINEPVPQFTFTPVKIGDALTAAGIAAYVGPQNVGGYPFGGSTDAVLDPNAPPTVHPATFYPMDSALPVGNNENKYDPDRGWQVFYLGDMTTNESCAFNTKPGDSPFLSFGGNLSKTLQVNAYDMTFSNPADVG